MSDESDQIRWRKPLNSNGTSRIDVLKQRHIIRKAVREYLDNEDFIEIDSPLLVRGTTPEVGVESFAVGDHYLATSTEYQMKRLAIGGFKKIYSLTQNFRPGDLSTYRNPEFTMLEWGRVGEPMSKIEEDAENFTLSAMAKLDLPETITYQGHKVDMRKPWERISVSKAVHRITGASIDDFELSSFRKAVEAAGITVREQWAEDYDFLFSVLMDYVQERLGFEKPVFLCDWPMFQTTSAKGKDDGKTAERSELFIAGVEVGDGFAGLIDASLQATLFENALKTRKKNNQPAVELDYKYLAAMRSGAPSGAGMAIGFDRLVMVLTDQPCIKNVLTLGWDEL